MARKSVPKKAVEQAVGGRGRKRPAQARPRARPVSSEPPAPEIKAPPVARLVPGPNEVVVRMYRQGLGDCFLLAFATADPEQPFYVLVDCGVHAREDDGPARLNQVMQHLKAATASRINIVVATHEHADHLSGFVQKGTPFLQDDFQIDELWVAWTEKRGDSQADALRKKRGAARAVIDKALEECRKRAQLGGAQLADQISGFNDFEEPLANAVDEHVVRKFLGRQEPKSTELQHYANRSMFSEIRAVDAKHPAPSKPSSNELALALLKAKARDNVEYCEPGQTLRLGKLTNVRAYALGPPRTDKLLKQDSPTKVRGSHDGDHDVYKEVYLSGTAGSQALALSPVLGLEAPVNGVALPDDWRYPFQKSFRREFHVAGGHGYQWTDPNTTPQRTKDILSASYLAKDASWRRIDADWLSGAGQLALNLDSDTNNTSLVLAFECGEPGQGRVLLFPGDAQVGNWLSWRDQVYRAGNVRMSADELLSRTSLYKVGHHGSHNATIRRDPRETTDTETLGVPFGLELMNDIVAMIPVDWAAAQKKMPDPWRMPHEPLYRRLREKSRRRVLRSDSELKPLNKAQEEEDLTPLDTAWKAVPGLKGLKWRQAAEPFFVGTAGPLYYDVAIPLAQDE